jgi:hypothetical protein
VSFFMNKFKKLGLIEYNGGLKVNHSLLAVILEARARPPAPGSTRHSASSR